VPALNHTGRLHPEKNISLRHKHLAPGNIVAEKGRVRIRTFLKQKREKNCVKNSIGMPAVNPTGILHPQKNQSGA
jgi:hypothetical protein